MKKDVIYIDTEDDITSIIGKVKAAEAKIVALVPPKRVGVLQSVVNLKLLQKTAGEIDKHLVLITNDNSLTSLAAGVRIPVAKNLQSKPEVAPIAALDVDDEDVINGDEMPVGDLAATVGASAAMSTPLAAEQLDEAADLAKTPAVTPMTPKPTPAQPFVQRRNPGGKAPTAAGGAKKGPKVPNFEKFRKLIFIGVGVLILLIAFLIWAIAYAPHATVTIQAKTTAVDITKNITLDPSLQQSDPTNATFKPQVQQLKKTASVTFTATGTKDIGQKATGTMTLTNSQSSDPILVPAGTEFVGTQNGVKFVSNQDVTVPGAKLKGGNILSGTASVGITAADVGDEYNIPAQSFTTSAPVSAATSAATGGGSHNKVTVVAQSDVDKATQQLSSQDANSVKDELNKQFTGDYIIIAESFGASPGAPTTSPNVGDQASQGKVTAETTYTELGLPRADVKKMLEAELNNQLQGKSDQSIYADGDNSIKFSQFQAAGDLFNTKLQTTGYIGPKIDTTKLAQQLQGKRYGEVQSMVDAIPGVENVDTKFWPFWVNQVPSPDKTEIKFSISNVTQ